MLPLCEQGGVLFDFKYGCRAIIPKQFARWRARMTDLDTGKVMLDERHDGVPMALNPGLPRGTLIFSHTRYFTRWGLEVWRDGHLVMEHEYNARKKPVFICTPNALGDLMTRMRAITNFRDKHKCRLTVQMADPMIQLFRGHKDYEDIELVGYDSAPHVQNQHAYYAAYAIGIFYGENSSRFERDHYLTVSNLDAAASILGVERDHRPPRLACASTPPRERYVTIAVQATTWCKIWMRPRGWDEVVNHLGNLGYRVICVDWAKDARTPQWADDATGTPLSVRARLIKHADLHVGGAGGMSWIAWALGTPVVAINGYSLEGTAGWEGVREVRNTAVCHGCWNDPAVHPVNTSDPIWCPKHRCTPREHECTRAITAGMVIEAIGEMLERPSNVVNLSEKRRLS